jgi:single-strand DNA-binding protein
MADFNKVIIIGRLTRDPQLKFTPQNMAICEFGVATGRKYKTASGEEREESTFVDCTLWGKGGEIFQKYMAKGRQVLLEGRLKFDQWEDKNGGGKRSKLTVVVENFQFLGDGKGQGGNAPSPTDTTDYSDMPSSGAPSSGGASGGGYSSGGGGSPARSGGYSSGNAPQSRPASRPAPNNPPYDEGSQQFKEDDIPF